MTALIVWGCILLFLLILLMSRATVIIDYRGDIRLTIKYFGITVFKRPSEKKSKKKPQKSGKKDKGEEDEEEEPDKKEKKKKPKKPLPTFDELMELVRLALDSLGKPLKRILKRVTFSHLSFTAVCGGSDAAKAAINYGAVNAALCSALNLIDTFFTLKAPDHLQVDVDFYEEKTELDLYFEIRTTVASVLAFPFSLIGRAIINYVKRAGARSAIKKLLGKPKGHKVSGKDDEAAKQPDLNEPKAAGAK